MKYSFLAILLSLASCTSNKSEEPFDFRAQNDEEINEYLSANNLLAKKSVTGLYYVIENIGTGAQPTQNSNVTVAYKGYFLNNEVFDQSDAAGISFDLQQVIKGWTEGITYFKEGGTGILLVPSHLGYGSFDTNGIPGGSVLIFEITLISVN